LALRRCGWQFAKGFHHERRALGSTGTRAFTITALPQRLWRIRRPSLQPQTTNAETMLALSLSASAFVAPGLAPRLPSADFGMTHGSRLANLQMVQARAQLSGALLSAAHSALGCARNSLTARPPCSRRRSSTVSTAAP